MVARLFCVSFRRLLCDWLGVLGSCLSVAKLMLECSRMLIPRMLLGGWYVVIMVSWVVVFLLKGC